MPVHKLSDPSRWVDLHGDYLFKYAVVRLRKRYLAEEAVQETFLAALKGQDSSEEMPGGELVRASGMFLDAVDSMELMPEATLSEEARERIKMSLVA